MLIIHGAHLAYATGTEEDSEAGFSFQRAHDCLELCWSVEEAGERRERMCWSELCPLSRLRELPLRLLEHLLRLCERAEGLGGLATS